MGGSCTRAHVRAHEGWALNPSERSLPCRIAPNSLSLQILPFPCLSAHTPHHTQTTSRRAGPTTLQRAMLHPSAARWFVHVEFALCVRSVSRASLTVEWTVGLHSLSRVHSHDPPSSSLYWEWAGSTRSLTPFSHDAFQLGPIGTMIKAILVFNNHGKVRLRVHPCRLPTPSSSTLSSSSPAGVRCNEQQCLLGWMYHTAVPVETVPHLLARSFAHVLTPAVVGISSAV